MILILLLRKMKKISSMIIIEIISKYKIKKYEYKKLNECNVDDEEL